MPKKIKTLTVGLISGWLLINISIAEETVYLRSAEPCRVVAYPAPGTAPLSEKLDCAEKANLLERQDRFARIRMGDEKIVWVADRNITTEVPAEQEVNRLLDYQKQIEAELAILNEQVNRLSETSAKLIKALIAAEANKQ